MSNPSYQEEKIPNYAYTREGILNSLSPEGSEQYLVGLSYIPYTDQKSIDFYKKNARQKLSSINAKNVSAINRGVGAQTKAITKANASYNNLNLLSATSQGASPGERRYLSDQERKSIVNGKKNLYNQSTKTFSTLTNALLLAIIKSSDLTNEQKDSLFNDTYDNIQRLSPSLAKDYNDVFQDMTNTLTVQPFVNLNQNQNLGQSQEFFNPDQSNLGEEDVELLSSFSEEERDGRSLGSSLGSVGLGNYSSFPPLTGNPLQSGATFSTQNPVNPTGPMSYYGYNGHNGHSGYNNHNSHSGHHSHGGYKNPNQGRLYQSNKNY